MHGSFVSRRSLLRCFGAGAALVAGAGVGLTVRAQAWPSRLRILCVAPAGGTPDLVARTYAQALGRNHPAGVIVENRPGAAGQIAIGALKLSAPDGATMLLAHGSVVTVYPHLYAKLAYDPVSDLAAVSLAADTAFGLAVGPAVPDGVRKLDEFIAWGRAHPSACSYGAPGRGTMPHLLGAMLFRQAKVDAQHVAYSSPPMAIGDALGGRLAAVVLPEGLLRPHHAAGKLRVLATSVETRSRFMPDVPTFVEQDYPGLVAREWFGFFMPGATPPAMLERMSQAVQAAAESDQVQTTLGEFAMRASAASPSAMNQRIAAERRHWQAAVPAMGLRLE